MYQHLHIYLLSISIVISSTASISAQSPALSDTEIWYDVLQTYPHLTVSPQQLSTARTLVDLNKHYEQHWVDTYLSVEISATHRGQRVRSISSSDTITQDQRSLLRDADHGSMSTVRVRYTPINELHDKAARENKFSFTMDPDTPASYPEGHRRLLQYLREQNVANIPRTTIQPYNVAAVAFVIDTIGHVSDVQLLHRSKDSSIDSLLMAAICNMKTWHPASYADGTKVAQSYVLAVGDHKSCTMNLLNVRHDPE